MHTPAPVFACDSTPRKRSVTIAGHRTSVSLEQPFWDALTEIAEAEGNSLAQLVTNVDAARGRQSLSSALRLYALRHFRDRGRGGPAETNDD